MHANLEKVGAGLMIAEECGPLIMKHACWSASYLAVLLTRRAVGTQSTSAVVCHSAHDPGLYRWNRACSGNPESYNRGTRVRSGLCKEKFEIPGRRRYGP